MIFLQRDKDFWQQYEKFFDEKLPPCVVTILRECGYTLMSTLTDFKSENLPELEEHIHGQLRTVIENFQCCNAETYKKQQKFQFLPAHRNLIIGLLSKIRAMKERRSKKSNRIRTTQSVEIDAVEVDIGIVQQNEITEKIQSELLKKLHDFGRSKNYSAVEHMSLADITEVVFSFGDGHSVGHCQIKCPYCENKYLTRYDKIWMTSISESMKLTETLAIEKMMAILCQIISTRTIKIWKMSMNLIQAIIQTMMRCLEQFNCKSKL